METRTKDTAARIIKNLSLVIKGKEEQLYAITAAVFAGGNILLEDVPGTGKTVLAKTLAKSIKCDFKRIQFTPDLLPSDITGIHYFNMKTQEFVLRKGGVFTNILLADEINRAGPRTQSALLECMEEKQVTIDGEILPLSSPFIVIATQNPVETAGTFPLPEAQLDRFLIRMTLGYAGREAELEILDTDSIIHPSEKTQPVTGGEELSACVRETASVKVNFAVKNYMIDIAEKTRHREGIRLGLSARGLLALKRMSQAFAAIEGADFVTPAHVQLAAPYVIPHRLICVKRTGADEMVKQIIEEVQVPTEDV